MSRSRTLAVTGGTGFVGSHVLRTARAQGHEIRALTRGWRPPEDGIDWVDGALDRADSLAKLCQGADAVVHIAGLINASSRAAFEAVNVGGTANIIDAARKAECGASSISRRWRASRSVRLWPFQGARRAPGRGVRARMDDRAPARGLRAGRPRDVRAVQDGAARAGRVAAQGRFSVLHVEDLCALILALLDEPDTLGETYEPDDGTPYGWEHRHFARTLGRIFGKRAATVSMPKVVMQGASRIERLVRRDKAKLTPDRVRYFCHPDCGHRAPAAAGETVEAADPHADRAQADRGMVSSTGLAEVAPPLQGQGRIRSRKESRKRGSWRRGPPAGCGRRSRASGISSSAAPCRPGGCRAPSSGRCDGRCVGGW